MKNILISLRGYLLMTVLLGFLYPLTVTFIGKMFFSTQASGSLIEKDGVIVGSALIGQKFESPNYFWGRPSAIDYNPQPSGGSNLGPISDVLRKTRQDRAEKFRPFSNTEIIPQELLFASASGIDPHISPEAALYQAGRIASVRGKSHLEIEKLIIAHTERRDFGFMGEPVVNLLRLNLALDEVLK